MIRFCLVTLAGVLGSSPAFAADDGIPEKSLDALKAATVYVKVGEKDGAAVGSGFLIRVDGEDGLVATNRHVIAGALSRGAAQKCSVVFGSGTKNERVLPATVLASDADQDLAVLKVTAKALPAPLDLKPARVRETMTVYTFGFPLGDLLSTKGTNPSVTIGKGTIGRLVTDGSGKLERIQLDGELNPGNSGGPIVDTEGKLVGIAVSKITGTKISFAIPPAELAEMLKGRAAPVVFRTLTVENDAAEVELEVPLIDPLQNVKTVEIRHIRQDALKGPPEPDKTGSWPALPGGEKTVAKIENGRAVAKVKLPAPDKKAFVYYFQSVCTTGDGASVTTRPVSQGIDFAKVGTVRLDRSPPWHSVTSKEGGFTIDLPTKPVINKSERRRTAAGVVNSVVLGSVTENGAYMAFRLELPTAVPRGSEARILDIQRDDFAEMWNGKVTGEKSVRAQGNPGRDFTVRGKPDEKNLGTIRVRQYLIGKTIYAVAVLSPPNQELPEDAGRFLGSLALGAAQTRATGTPEPELKGTEIKGWGTAIDPDKDCKLTTTEKGITFQIPGKLHDLFFDGGATNAPRVLREVEGDFVATVKVIGDFKPGPKSTNPKSVPFHGAGFLLWSDSDNNIRFERFAWLRAGKFTTGALFEEREGGYAGAAHTELFKVHDCYLRVERTGSRITGSISSDGTTWRKLKPVDTVWPSKLKIGLTAITTSSSPFTVKFEEFELKQKP